MVRAPILPYRLWAILHRCVVACRATGPRPEVSSLICCHIVGAVPMVPFASLPVDRETADQTSVGARLRSVCMLFQPLHRLLPHTPPAWGDGRRLGLRKDGCFHGFRNRKVFLAKLSVSQVSHSLQAQRDRMHEGHPRYKSRDLGRDQEVQLLRRTL